MAYHSTRSGEDTGRLQLQDNRHLPLRAPLRCTGLHICSHYEAERLQLPPALAELPDDPNGDVDALAYAYWLGFIYRCECLMHEESSRMVYGAFDEHLMRSAYDELLLDQLGQCDLMDSAMEICARLDRLLAESIWPAKALEQKRLQALETDRSSTNK